MKNNETMLKNVTWLTQGQQTYMMKKTWRYWHGAQTTSMMKKRDVTDTGPTNLDDGKNMSLLTQAQQTSMMKKRDVTD